MTTIEQFISDFPSIKDKLAASGCYESWENDAEPNKSRLYAIESSAISCFFEALNYDYLSKHPNRTEYNGWHGHNNPKQYTPGYFEKLRDDQIRQARETIERARQFQNTTAYTKSSDWSVKAQKAGI